MGEVNSECISPLCHALSCCRNELAQTQTPVAPRPRILTGFSIEVGTFKHGLQPLSVLMASSSVFQLASFMCSLSSSLADLLHSLNNVVFPAPLLGRMLVPDWLLFLRPGVTAQLFSLSSFVKHAVVGLSRPP